MVEELVKMYVITNGKNYVSFDVNNNFTPTTNIKNARKYTEEKAKNVLKNFPKSLQNLNYYLEEYEIVDENTKNQVSIILNTDTDKTLKDMAEVIKKFESYMQSISSFKQILSIQLSNIDKEIEDILHDCEFNSYNASKGYLVYKKMHDARVKRRKIKNYLEAIGYLESMTGKDYIAQNGSKSILGMLERKYSLRTN